MNTLNVNFIFKVDKDENDTITDVYYTIGLRSNYVNKVNKKFVVNEIKKGFTWFTKIKKYGIWVCGSEVHVYRDEYIRTDSNSIEHDNLDELE